MGPLILLFAVLSCASGSFESVPQRREKTSTNALDSGECGLRKNSTDLGGVLNAVDDAVPPAKALAETITKPSRVEEKKLSALDEDDEDGDVEPEGEADTAPDGDPADTTTTSAPKKKSKKSSTTPPPGSTPKKKAAKKSTTTTPEPSPGDEDDEELPSLPKKKSKRRTTTPDPAEDGETEETEGRGRKNKKSSGDGDGDEDETPPEKKSKRKTGTSTPVPGETLSTSSSSSKWEPTLKGGKFVDFRDIIEYLVQHSHDRTFSGMLVFQVIKYRNGDAAVEKRLVDRLIKCLKPALPELRVLATLRRRMRLGLSGRDRDQARGLAARTVTTAIKHFYYAADEEGLTARLIVGVINAMHTFEQASYSDPLEEKGPGHLRGGVEREGHRDGYLRDSKGNDGFDRSSSRLRDSYLSFEEELERLLDEIESDIMDDYEASLRGQFEDFGDEDGYEDSDDDQKDILDAIGAVADDEATFVDDDFEDSNDSD